MPGFCLSTHTQKHHILENGAGPVLGCKCEGEVPIRVGLIWFCQQELIENIEKNSVSSTCTVLYWG
jgi:hypothetical protein